MDSSYISNKKCVAPNSYSKKREHGSHLEFQLLYSLHIHLMDFCSSY